MKKRFKKACLGILVIGITIFSSGSAFAKGEEAGTFGVVPDVQFDFYVSGTSGSDTANVVKQSTNGPYWVQLISSTAPNNIIINTVMHNLDHEVRGQGKVLEGTSASIGSWGTAGYYYHGNIWREFEWDPGVSVYGYFSPDNY